MERGYEVVNRVEIANKVALTAQTGDILFRGSLAKGPYGLPFMKLVSQVTKSKFTHAATLFWECDKLYVLEETDIGTMQYRFIDWLTFCVNGEFACYRMKGITKEQQNTLQRHINKILELDPSYDYTFSDPNKFYCTESVGWLYSCLGVELMKTKTIVEVAGKWRAILISIGSNLIKKLTKGTVSLNLKGTFYYVGNETNDGFMSSPLLEEVMFEI